MTDEFFINNLNYAMANEDTSVERAVAKSIKAQKIFTVCGSGSRAFPLIHPQVKELDLIDMSETQLAWAKLRQQTIIELSHGEFMQFWGYETMSGAQRKEKFKSLFASTSVMTNDLFNNYSCTDPVYYGGWEKTYQKLNSLVKLVVGEKRINKLIETNDLATQWKTFQSLSFQLRWKFVLIFVGNRSLFNSLLYKGKFVEKNLPESYVRFYINAFERLFKRSLIKDSYFLQMSFLGKIKFATGAPIEANVDVFDDVKKHLPDIKVSYLQNDLVQYLASGSKQYDFLSLSDVPSYFDDKLGHEFLQKIKPSVALGGVVVVRYYLREYYPDCSGYKDISSDFQEFIDNESVQMYSIKIYQRL